MMKRSIYQEDIIIVKNYAPNVAVIKYIEQILTELKGKISSNTVTAGDFNTQFFFLKFISFERGKRGRRGQRGR